MYSEIFDFQSKMCLDMCLTCVKYLWFFAPKKTRIFLGHPLFSSTFFIVCTSVRLPVSQSHWKFLPKTYQNRITPPAYPCTTDAVIYTAQSALRLSGPTGLASGLVGWASGLAVWPQWGGADVQTY